MEKKEKICLSIKVLYGETFIDINILKKRHSQEENSAIVYI